MVASRAALLLFSSNVKIEHGFKETVLASKFLLTLFFKRYKVLSYEKIALLTR